MYEYRPWPQAFAHRSLKVGKDYHRLYDFADGPAGLPGVTTVLKVANKPGLIGWAADTEHEAVIAAAEIAVADRALKASANTLREDIEARLGEAKQHQKIAREAADIGTAIHAGIHRFLLRQMGEDVPEPEEKPEPVWIGIASFEDWWRYAGYTPVLMEQPFWSKFGFAGQIDLIARAPDGFHDIVDIKSSKGVWDEYHEQVAAYLIGGNEYMPIRGGLIFRTPKNIDNLTTEAVPLGKLWNRTLEIGELQRVFLNDLYKWQTLYGPREGQ